MTIEEASRAFSNAHIGTDWLAAVGVGRYEGKPAIYVYTKKMRAPAAVRRLTEYEGYPLVWRYTGPFVLN